MAGAHSVNDPGSSVYVDALIDGAAWDLGTPLKYYFDNSKNPGDPWTASEMNAFGLALNIYSSSTNLEFVETNTKSDANFDWQKWTSKQIGADVLGQHYLPEPTASNQRLEGDFNYQDSSWQNLTQGSYGFITIIHELGHGMGLDHPFDGSPTFPGSGTFNTGTFKLNQGIWTTMTYNDGWDQRPSPSHDYGWQGSMMSFDIAALQVLYGANMSTATGDDVYQLDTANAPGTFWSCIWDAGGTDTISNAGSAIGCSIDLRPASLTTNDPHAGGYVSSDNGIVGGFTIANNVTIENAIGGDGNDIITGNDAVNDLQGGAGNDVIDGKGGADTMTGGSGDDTYFVDDAGDVVIEQPGGGNDTVFASVAIATPAEVENFFMIDANTIVGTAGKDNLTGTANADTVFGLGDADTMTGLGGNDTYYVDNVGDQAVEAANGGTDTVRASVNYTLGVNVENLILDNGAINGTGNALNNTLTGNDAGNTLDGKTGADTMIGGKGDDIYVVDNLADTVTENPGEGTDTIQASITFTLADGNNVENLTLLGAVISGTGNADNNTITGNAAANILDGKAGADTMMGLAGNDTYFVDDAGDQIIEAVNGGTDTVKTAIDFSLALFANVENLILLGTADIGTGNALANTITGNGGNNQLDGGVGNDTLVGGLGDDTYVVDSSGDKVTEAVNGGTDTIHASVSYTIAANVENLILDGSSTINGTGSAAADHITGNDNANVLNGMAGADTLIGHDGNDTYIVDNIGDLVIEDVNNGVDTVNSAMTHTLEANVENLLLTGSAAINGTGNDLANTLTGNSGANSLDGGLGADTMIGLAGNDTYIVDDAGDVVTEAASGGTDTVKTSLSYTLGANVENLVLTGTGNVNGTGNTLANAITGNDGNNTLTGGLGIDRLTGGAGADTFHFNALADKGDIITDFVSGVDTIEIVAAGFAGAVAGDVHLAIVAGKPVSPDGHATFLLNSQTGGLFWDDDGNGAHAAQQIAALTGVHALDLNHDLLIV